MLVQVRPITGTINTWEGTDESNFVRNPLQLRAQLGRDSRYKVAIDEKRLEALESETGRDLSLRSLGDLPHPFWDESVEARVTLNAETTIFDTSRPIDEIRVGILRAHDEVANSLSDAAGNPLVRFVIYSEEEEASKRASKIQKTSDCYRKLAEVGRETKNNLIRILNGRDVSGHSNEDVILGILGEAIEKDPGEVLKWLNTDIQELSMRALVLRGISSGDLRQDGANIRYGDVFLGTDVDEVIRTLSADENQAIMVRLREKLS